MRRVPVVLRQMPRYESVSLRLPAFIDLGGDSPNLLVVSEKPSRGSCYLGNFQPPHLKLILGYFTEG